MAFELCARLATLACDLSISQLPPPNPPCSPVAAPVAQVTSCTLPRCPVESCAEGSWRFTLPPDHTYTVKGKPFTRGVFKHLFHAHARPDQPMHVAAISGRIDASCDDHFTRQAREAHARELAAAVRLLPSDGAENPYVVSILGWYIDPAREQCWLIMPYYELGDLYNALYREEGPDFLGRSLTSQEQYRLSFQAMQAVEYIHERGVLHCDIKPENALLTMSSAGLRFVLADFGAAIALGDQKSAFIGLGTIGLIPPEVHRARRDHDHNAKFLAAPTRDLWALGLMIYELLRTEVDHMIPWMRDMDHQFDPARIESLLRLPPKWRPPLARHAPLWKQELFTGLLSPEPGTRLSLESAMELFEPICRKVCT